MITPSGLMGMMIMVYSFKESATTHPIRICQTEISVVHKTFNSMQLGDFLLPDQSPPEVVIIGTGKKHLFLSPKLQVDLFTKQLYAETMPTASAVHSFNLLTADKRRIFTWLWL